MTTALASGALAALAVLVAARACRPAAARLRGLVRAVPRDRPPAPLSAAMAPTGGRPGTSPVAAAPVARRLFRRAPRADCDNWPSGPAGAGPASNLAHRVPVLAVAVLAGLVGGPVPALAVLAAGTALPVLARRRARRRRAAVTAAAVPEVVDLLALAVGAGLTPHLALPAVAERLDGVVGTELRRVVDQVASGRRLAEALEELPARLGEPYRPVVAALATADRYGTPVVDALERLAAEARDQQRRQGEAAARRVPVTLLFPLVLCILPAFVLLTLVPLLAGAVRELRL